jgi:hypothetical protein
MESTIKQDETMPPEVIGEREEPTTLESPVNNGFGDQ